ncbi:MAG: hypothetical protein GEU28_01610 [Dehalococcoidia bacterium]|nr:hypothetical protein [Dehalococcoidia bacterium]
MNVFREPVSGAVIKAKDRDDAAGPGIRIAILATPRSGTTWLRMLLQSLYHLSAVAGSFQPHQVDLSCIPRYCVLQTHWGPTEAVQALLEQFQLRVVTIARHPLDVLISHLQWGRHQPLGWPVPQDASPLSPEFLDYARTRAAASFGLTRDWWQRRDAVRLRYEALVSDGISELQRAVDELALPVAVPVAEALGANSMGRLHSENPDHFWQGRPGLWRTLIPTDTAYSIADANRETFEVLSYSCAPDDQLTKEQAERNWLDLVSPADISPGP